MPSPPALNLSVPEFNSDIMDGNSPSTTKLLIKNNYNKKAVGFCGSSVLFTPTTSFCSSNDLEFTPSTRAVKRAISSVIVPKPDNITRQGLANMKINIRRKKGLAEIITSEDAMQEIKARQDEKIENEKAKKQGKLKSEWD